MPGGENTGQKGKSVKHDYRILQSDGTLLNAGTLDKSSWFTLEEARKLVNRERGDKILWCNGGYILGEAF